MMETVEVVEVAGEIEIGDVVLSGWLEWRTGSCTRWPCGRCRVGDCAVSHCLGSVASN